MEQMDRNEWWIGVYNGDERVSIFLRSNLNGKITATIAEDEIGCEYANYDEKTGKLESCESVSLDAK